MTRSTAAAFTCFADLAQEYAKQTDSSSYEGAFAEQVTRAQLSVHDEPSDDAMPDPEQAQQCVSQLTSSLFDLLSETRLEPFAQRLAWGIINSFHMVAQQTANQEDDAAQKLKTLISCYDPSEIYAVEVEEAQTVCQSLAEARSALECMRDHAAEIYRVETGKPWQPRTGSKTSSALNASMIDARDFLHARAKERRERHALSGPLVVVSGRDQWEHYEPIYDALDAAKALTPNMTLITTAQRTGVDAIAAAWAASNGIKIVAYKPNFAKHGRAAGFRRNETLVNQAPVQAIICAGSHLQVDLAQKMRAAGVPLVLIHKDEARSIATPALAQAA